MKLERLKELHGTDGNETCHEFWDQCGTEIIALMEAADEQAYDHGEPSDNEPGLVVTSCQCSLCLASNAINRKLAAFE